MQRSLVLLTGQNYSFKVSRLPTLRLGVQLGFYYLVKMNIVISAMNFYRKFIEMVRIQCQVFQCFRKMQAISSRRFRESLADTLMLDCKHLSEELKQKLDVLELWVGALGQQELDYFVVSAYWNISNIAESFGSARDVEVNTKNCLKLFTKTKLGHQISKYQFSYYSINCLLLSSITRNFPSSISPP